MSLASLIHSGTNRMGVKEERAVRGKKLTDFQFSESLSTGRSGLILSAFDSLGTRSPL